MRVGSMGLIGLAGIGILYFIAKKGTTLDSALSENLPTSTTNVVTSKAFSPQLASAIKTVNDYSNIGLSYQGTVKGASGAVYSYDYSKANAGMTQAQLEDWSRGT